LFLCAMVCHGELVKRKPSADHLTTFYLLISAGGAAGGIFVGIVAPRLLQGYFELHIALFGCALLMLLVLFTDRESWFYKGRPYWCWVLMLILLTGFGTVLVLNGRQEGANVMAVNRNFYGVLRVKHSFTEYRGRKSVEVRLLVNGQITHGLEFEDPQIRRDPTTYYGRNSGIGRLLTYSLPNRQRRVGLVGLGIGTLATYARPGDQFRFYEINPAVEKFAREYFHYLGDCQGRVDVVPGDARLTLDRESPQNFDVLVLDAFSGDAIPTHLLTLEAFAIYLRNLAPDGVIAVHVSSRHFALQPVVRALADAYELAFFVANEPEFRGA